MNNSAPSDGSTLASSAKAEAGEKAKGQASGSFPCEGTALVLSSSAKPHVSAASGPTSFGGGINCNAAAFLEASKAYIAPWESTNDVNKAPSGGSSEQARISTMSTSHFPHRLFDILANDEHAEIISWLPHGLGFRIHQKKRFAAEIMPQYFKQSKFTSFTRKLNRWTFTRVTGGPETGSYYHPYFKRGDLQLCLKMKRCKQAAKVPGQSDGGNPLVSDELRTRQQLEQRRMELLLRKHQEQQLVTHAFLQGTGLPPQAADPHAFTAAVNAMQRNNTNAYLAMLLGHHNSAQMNPLEEIRRQQAAMFLHTQQQQIVPYAQEQESRPVDAAKGKTQLQKPK